MLLLLAWRNLWRNTHRTLITTASVLFAVVLVLFTRSMQLGSYEHAVNTTLRISTGYLQIQAKGFWIERSLDNSIEADPRLALRIRDLHPVTTVVPRIESFALASAQDRTRGVMVIAVDPVEEDRMSGLSGRMKAGAYLEPGSPGVLVSAQLSEYLRVTPGDTLVLLSQGFQAMTAAGLFPIQGIVDLPVPDLNAATVYLSLDEAQWFYSMPGRITSWAIMVQRPAVMGQVRTRIDEMLPDDQVVMTWREMLPEMVQFIEVDNAGGVIMLGILYIVIGFGIFGTAMMMVAERRREFAILVSVGMKRRRLSTMVLLESMTLAVLGTLAGVIVSIPLLLYMRGNPIRLDGRAAEAMLQYGFEPILPFLVDVSLFVRQGLVVTGLAILATLYPVWSISRLKISAALRS